MRAVTNDYLIDGQPLLAPDQDVEFQCSDLDAADAGRDESGVMHRIVEQNDAAVCGENHQRKIRLVGD